MEGSSFFGDNLGPIGGGILPSLDDEPSLGGMGSSRGRADLTPAPALSVVSAIISGEAGGGWVEWRTGWC